VPRTSFAATFPTIHPFAVVIEFVINEYGVGRINQSLFCAEELIVRKYDTRAQSWLLKSYPLVEGIFILHFHCLGSFSYCSDMADKRNSAI
jgi:hypothetical protein